MKLKDFKTVEERRQYLEKELSTDLSNIGSFSLDGKKANSRNCENMIGIAQIPLGIAGPLKISGQYAQGDFYIPLATTEGALVASINRGAKAITESGGAYTDIHKVGVTRGPVFQVKNLKENHHIYEFLETHFKELKIAAEETSRHLKLKKITSRGVGKYRYIRFYFDTGEAMGMNMATIATEKMTQIIESKTKSRCISIAGNFDNDKKPSWLNIIENRGFKVWAEATIPSRSIEKTLKTTAQSIYDVWLAKCMLGSAMAGSMGFNAHFANVLTALFIATGQDVAHTVEGSLGITTTQVSSDNLYISVYLPDLLVGTVGGGTNLETQKEALSVMGIRGEKNSSLKFAEICGAAVLAGELSLLASLAEGSLASAHQKLGRGK